LAVAVCQFFLLSHGRAMVPDALTQPVAIQIALSQNKMILLTVSDTNNCTGCVGLEYSTLLSTDNPTMQQFLGESFILWACGPEQGCTEFRTYAGDGTVPLPMFFIIDPHNPQYYYPGSGDYDPNAFYSWARVGLLKMTKPMVTTPLQNQTFPDKNIQVLGRSISTNVTISYIYYQLNGGGWTFSKVSDGINWQVALDPAQVTDSNLFEVYAIDRSLNKSQTNAVAFFYSKAKIPASVALGGLSQLYDGTAKPATATTTPAGLTVNFTYDGSANAPTNAGSYTVVGTISDPTYQGSATGTLVIGNPASAPALTWERSGQIITIGGLTNGFKLQSSPILPATNWQDVAGSETANASSITIGPGNQFFRLKK
jgi:hypothetical protein